MSTTTLPEQLSGLTFGVLHRGRRLRVAVTADEATYTLTDGESGLVFTHHGQPQQLAPGETLRLTVPPITPPPRARQPPGRHPQRRHPRRPHA